MIFSFTHHGEGKPPLWVQGDVTKQEDGTYLATSPQLPSYEARGDSIVGTATKFRDKDDLSIYFAAHPEARSNIYVQPRSDA